MVQSLRQWHNLQVGVLFACEKNCIWIIDRADKELLSKVYFLLPFYSWGHVQYNNYSIIGLLFSIIKMIFICI